MTGDAGPRYLNAGESALVVEFGQAIDEAIHDRVLALDAAMTAANVPGVIDTVPTYRSLMIHFNPALTSGPSLIDVIGRMDHSGAPRTAARHWRFPVCYEPPFAEDLGEIASVLGLSQEEIIALHSGALYRVYMFGFAPGFTFLGGLPDALAIPRRAAPRAPVAPGSLLIAAGQALIAGSSMPTGWYQIGRTPLRVFDPKREPMTIASIGDTVSFERIDAAHFAEMSAAAGLASPNGGR